MRARWLGILLVAAACDSGTEDGTGDNTNPITNADGGTLFDSGIKFPDAATTPFGDSGTSTPAPSASGLPCDVESIVKAKCGTCHIDPPLFGATMALTKQSHFTAISTVVPGATVASRVKARIADAAKPMPPVGQATLTDAEKATLNAWIDGGAKPATTGCSTPTSDGGTTPVTDGGGTVITNPDNKPYLPPDSECDYLFEVKAHGGQTRGDTSAFTPGGGDNYEIFYFTPPWTEDVHVTRIDPIIDNAAVLHHWLLYQQVSGGGGDGTHKSDSGLQSGDAQLLSGWAPGNNSLPIPKHVGLTTVKGPAGRLGIELHYNTSSNPANRADRSGARLCATKTLREHPASVHWLGTQAIVLLGGMGTAAGRCTPALKAGQVAHIIAHSPHMHTTGVHAKTSVKRKADGKDEVLWDAPFSFDDQQIFPVPNADGEQQIFPGDVLTTTCTYNSPGLKTFGPNTDQEMCYNFVVAWPVGSLSNGINGVVGGQNTCIDPGT